MLVEPPSVTIRVLSTSLTTREVSKMAGVEPTRGKESTDNKEQGFHPKIFPGLMLWDFSVVNFSKRISECLAEVAPVLERLAKSSISESGDVSLSIVLEGYDDSEVPTIPSQMIQDLASCGGNIRLY